MAWLTNKLANYLGRSKASDLAKERQKELAANPKAVEQEYARAERNLKDAFPGQDAAKAPVQQCPMAKADRRKARKALVAKGEASSDPAANAAAGRLKRMMDDVERARLAKHVYLDQSDAAMPQSLKDMKAPPGFLPASEDDLAAVGLSPSDLRPQDIGMKSVAYKYDPEIWGSEYADRMAIAFRGSTLAEEDWTNNMLNGTGEDSAYYKQAKSIGTKVRMAGASDRVDSVGHSLGGGLAQAMHAGTQGKSKTTTYNSAGVRDDLANKYGSPGAFDEGKISAYRVKGEALTKAQEKGVSSAFAPSAKGTKYDMEPADSALRNRKLTDKESTDLHAMDEVIESFENQKSADEAVLAGSR